MERKLNFWLKNLKKLLLGFAVFLLSLNAAVADDNEATLMEGFDNIDSIADEIIEVNEKRSQGIFESKKHIEALQQQLKEGVISIEAAQKASAQLQEELEIKRNLLKENDADYKEMEENFNRYVFQTKAQKYTPLIYALAALHYSSQNDTGQDILYGLAGFGFGSMVEDTGYGFAGLITFFKYDFD